MDGSLDSNDWEGVCPEKDVIDDLNKKDKNHTHMNSKGKFNVTNVQVNINISSVVRDS